MQKYDFHFIVLQAVTLLWPHDGKGKKVFCLWPWQVGSLPRLDAVRQSFLIFKRSWELWDKKIKVLNPPKNSPALRRRIRRAVREDTGRSLTQIKAHTDADKLAVLNLQGSTKLGTLKGGRKFYSLMRKIVPEWSWWLPTLLAWQGDPTGDVFYAAQWRRLHCDLGCFFLQWENGASGYAGVSNAGWLCGHVAASILLDWGPSSVR